MMMHNNYINLTESTKITLTVEQLRRIVDEAVTELPETVFITEEEQVDEGLGRAAAMAVAGALALGNIVRADNVSRGIAKAETPQQVQNAVNNAERKNYGKWTAVQATNVLMRTIYQEAKGESPLGRKLVATVIWNRAGGDPNKMPDVCLKKYQFSVWNGLDAKGRTPAGFTTRVPKSVLSPGDNQNIWNEVKGLVEKMLNGSFDAQYDYNVYLNKSTAGNKALTTWVPKMRNSKDFGKHTFGYLPEYDGFRTAVSTPKYPTSYTVKNGDNGVSYIAKHLIDTKQTAYTDTKQLTGQIIKINSFKTDKRGNPIIKVGQTIKLPS